MRHTLFALALFAGGHGFADTAAALADEAVAQSPDLAAAATTLEALSERVRGAGAWMDPQLTVTYGNMPIDAWVMGRSPMSGVQVQLRQTFLWPGKVAAREEEAQGQVHEQEQTLAERRVQLRAMVQRAYVQLALVRHLRAVTVEHVTLVDQFLGAVRVRLEVGKVSQHDLLRLQVLRQKLADDLNAFQRDETALTGALNAALHRDAGTAVETPDRLVTTTPTSTAEQLLADAVEHRPLLARYLAQAETRRAAARRAGREGYPDLSAFAGYTLRTPAGSDPGTDFVTLGIALPLPVFSQRHFRGLARESELMAKGLEQQREAEIDRLRADLSRVVAAWTRAVQEAATYRRDLLPAAHQTLDATAAAWAVDRADFASLFQAELQLLDFERVARQADAQAALARIEAQALTGKDLP